MPKNVKYIVSITINIAIKSTYTKPLTSAVKFQDCAIIGIKFIFFFLLQIHHQRHEWLQGIWDIHRFISDYHYMKIQLFIGKKTQDIYI